MMDLTKKTLPNTVRVGGRDFSIHTDFRVWIQFSEDLKKMKNGEHRDISYIFINNMPVWCNAEELLPFYSPKSELPRGQKHSDVIAVDYMIDADYIYSAFLSQYGIDLIEVKELHWHKFLALFKGLKQDEMICKIMAYRTYEKKDAKKDVYEELKYAWQIEYITEEDEKAMERFSSYFE